MGLRIDLCRNCPGRPSRRASLDAVNVHDRVTEDRIIYCRLFLRPDFVVQLRHTVGCGWTRAAIAWIGGAHDCRRGELANGDMIGVSISSFRTKCDDDLRPDGPQVSHDPRYDLGRISLVQVAVDVVQEMNLVETKRLPRGAQFSLANSAKRILTRICLRVTKPAAFPARCRDEIRFDALGGLFRQRTARTKRLVVGVGEHAHQFKVVGHTISPDSWRPVAE